MIVSLVDDDKVKLRLLECPNDTHHRAGGEDSPLASALAAGSGACVGSALKSFQEPIVFGMRTNPEPVHRVPF